MKFTLIHHHLHPGGVTSVIRQQLRAIAGFADLEGIQIMSGEAADLSLPDVEIMVNPRLNYHKCSGMTASAVHNEIALLANYILNNTDKEAILTVHNLSLAKNPLLNCAMKTAAEQGRNVLYYCHDFAEDRPENIRNLQYVAENVLKQSVQAILYPDLPNCRYAALTSHDVLRLQRCGIAAEHVALLPNPVVLPQNAAPAVTPAQIMRELDLAPGRMNFLYPVRGIRRKNMGEFILLSAVYGDRANWITTLPPKNPDEKIEYEYWLKFCRAHNLNVRFGAGERFDLSSLMNASDACFTTSIMEGFGMVFLEPWLFKRPVMGRELYVCADFRRSGIDFPVLYAAITVEKEDGTLCDFAGLDTAGKITFITRLLEEPEILRQFKLLNPALENIFLPVDARLTDRNKQIIENEYSLETYGARLHEIYKTFF